MDINELSPSEVFSYFQEICAIPHGYGNTGMIADYCLEFAKLHGLKARKDTSDNVVIFKAGSSGYEDCEPVILQGHLDMVCEKEPDCDIDMSVQSIKACTDGKMVWADGTTLGADDGIAVAFILAVLAATLSIGLGFFVSYAIFHQLLGAGSWKALGALCGSWMGGGGNMLAIQAALDVDEATMAYALVMDSICATLYVMFLLWAIGNHEKFNKWTKADTSIIDGVGATLEEEAKANTKPLVWQNIILLLGSGLLVSAVSMELGSMINAHLSFFDSTTWTVLIVSVLGIVFALTPFGKIKGTEEISNVMLYIVIALIASRADLGAVGNAPIWLLAGFVILLIHVAIMIALAKILKLDIFTCSVASLANIGGTATAPVLAGAYSNALVPVGIMMALLGYVIGTGGGLVVANLMSIFG